MLVKRRRLSMAMTYVFISHLIPVKAFIHLQTQQLRCWMLAIQWYKIQEILQPQISYNRPLSYLSLTSKRNTDLLHADAWMHSAEFYVQCLFLFIRFKLLVEICKSHQIVLLVWWYFVCKNVFGQGETCPSEDITFLLFCQEISLRQRRTKTRTWSSILFRKTETVCLWWQGKATEWLWV